MSGFVVPEEVKAIQARATDPSASAWVSANAGAGKTHVLTERVVQLMAAGARPEAILCLTYTTAAAAEMKARVFRRLAELALAPDEKIDAFLAAAHVAGGDGAEPRRARVRRLFAEALETPGGLRIQTIHAFCAALLRQFPLEANVSGRFSVLDDAARDELTEGAILEVFAEAARAPDGEVAGTLADLLDRVGPARVADALAAAAGERRRVTAFLRTLDDGEDLRARIAEGLGLDPADTVAVVEDEILAGTAFTPERLDALARACDGGGKQDGALAARIAAFRADPVLDAFLDVFCTAGDGLDRQLRKATTFATKRVKAELDWLEAALEEEHARLARLIEARRAAATAEATAALFALADRAIAAVEREKRRAGLIDYDDQIERAAALLGLPEAADWVRYKLDRGIDHILVDEAQDTSPDQWWIVSRLAEEFFAGAGGREAARTLFVVGDGKQSIYSFQGAEPAGFDRERRRYERAARAAGSAFHAVGLRHSFRSAPEVLSAVDAVFADPERAAALFEGETGVRHAAIREGAAGGVEVWPVLRDAEPEVPDDWALPLDHDKRRSGALQLATRIARTVRDWLDRGLVFSDGAPLSPGDVMVLVRRRAGFADLMNRAFKAEGIPVAGADRLDLVAEIAIEDLMALARAALTPDDELSLAALLKSPLVGLSEDDLFRLAHDRPGRLADALRARADEPAFAAAARQVARWAERARGARPFDFFAEVLGPEGGRRRFLSRLGTEVAEVLDAFLGMALDHERSAIPTLEAFLRRLALSRSELKREAGEAADAARVMTVHGAKGLEARLVFLVDHCGAPVSAAHLPAFLDLPAGADKPTHLAWSPDRAHRPAAVEEALALRKAAGEAEYLRLLYVGMTRARERLVVCGYAGRRDPPDGCWHALVRQALAPLSEEVADAAGEPCALRYGAAPRFVPRAKRDAAERAPALPAALARPADPARPAVAPARASAGLGARPVPKIDPAAAAARAGEAAPLLHPVERGSLVHMLLEHLPGLAPDERAAAGGRLLAASRPDLPAAEAQALVAEACAALADPEIAALFAADALVERDVLGDVRYPDGTVRRVSGRIDRLVTAPDRLVVVDVKTDRTVPASAEAVPATYLGQLALYRALVAPLAGGRPVHAALLYTAGPRLLAVDAALPAGVEAAGLGGAGAA